MSRVLVLLSAYNGGQNIEEQIVSIMNQQSAHEIHLRVRDDGSSDDTCEIVRRLAESYPGRIEIIEGKNIGVNASYFELLHDASGFDYYAISDQDDIFMPQKYETAVDLLNKEDQTIPLLFSCTSYLTGNDMRPYGETRRQQKEFTLYNTIIQNICPGHNQVFNNALLDLVKCVDDPGRIYVYDMWITNTAMLYGKIIFVNTPLTYYRQHEGNLMGTSSSTFGRLAVSCKRLFAGDGGKTRKQIEYFVEINEDKLKKQGYYNELKRFLSCNKNYKRIMYSINSKLYRQTTVETICFRVAVCMGLY